MNVVDEYEEVINGQAIKVQVIEPQPNQRYMFEYAHEILTENRSLFRAINPDIDENEKY